MTMRKGPKVLMPIVTPNTKDEYPAIDSNDVAGGFMYFDSLIDALTIPEEKRKLGMHIFTTSTQKEYILINNPANTSQLTVHDWLETNPHLNRKDMENVCAQYMQRVNVSLTQNHLSELTFQYLKGESYPSEKILEVNAIGPVILQFTKEMQVIDAQGNTEIYEQSVDPSECSYKLYTDSANNKVKIYLTWNNWETNMTGNILCKVIG